MERQIPQVLPHLLKLVNQSGRRREWNSFLERMGVQRGAGTESSIRDIKTS
jgi:hypothetical protein